MKKYILLFFVLSILFFPSVLGKEVTIEMAKTVAIKFLEERNLELNSMLISNPIIVQKESISTYYTFKFENGFIIISADNSVFPVLGYSFESNFFENNIPPAFSYWMDQLSEQILFNIQMEAKAPENISKSWEKYLSGNFVPTKIEDGIPPLLNSSWDQGCYYNSAFPYDPSAGPCERPYAGCVAVVLGQIMKYYNWPKTGTGQNTINSPYGDLTASFGNTSYDWISMESYLSNENSAVAELIYHGAIAVNSEFLPQGTGAYDYNIPPALINYFKFRETAQFIYRNSYFGDWEQLIRDELVKGRPVVYGGIDFQQLVGHTFICDGYQDSSFFHFNWGWGGQYNGYYYIDSLIVGPYHFDYQHDVVIGIEPDISGIVELYPPENLFSEVEMRDVSLSWDAPPIAGTLELLGYNVFRNDTLLNKSILSTTNFTDIDAPPGNHIYKVNTTYIGNGVGRSTEIETYVSAINDVLASTLDIFPNPTNGKLWIKANHAVQNSEVLVCNLSGKEIMNIPFQHSFTEQAFDLSSLSKGVYFLRFTFDKQVFTKKLIIN